MRKKKFNKDTLALDFYKWQFLRRNKKYQKDYDEVVRKYNKEIPFKIVMDFVKRWGTEPLDYKVNQPNIKFAPFGRLSPIVPVACLTREYRGNLLSLEGIKPIPEKEIAKNKVILIGIDLSFHRATLLKEIKRIISRFQRRRNKFYKSYLSFRPSVYKLYLKAYDMKQRFPDIPLKQLARKLKIWKLKLHFNDEFYKSQRTHEDRLSKILKKCDELIGGGYRKINL